LTLWHVATRMAREKGMRQDMADFALGGRVALVTGASAGLGRHFADVLAGAGAAVALAARRRESLEEAVRDIAARGGRAAALVCDVTEGESVAATVTAAEAALGPVDILVNNAGIAISKPMLEHTEEEWDRVVDTNLKGAWLMSRALAERWVKAGRRGRIINIASLLALRPIRHVPSYCAAKAGLAHLTHTMAMELARKGITVNAIAPGYFETDMNRAFLRSEVGQALISRIPMGRSGVSSDLDGALLLLASAAGAYITGAVLPVDGGHAVAAV
jgi:NAD(P)-dependent dehydrogenase (short-subunit alcohol dehydrogenase family)